MSWGGSVVGDKGEGVVDHHHARAGRGEADPLDDPGHALADGGADHERRRIVALDAILRAAADVFAAACSHAVVAAIGDANTPAYLDLCPSALRS